MQTTRRKNTAIRIVPKLFIRIWLLNWNPNTISMHGIVASASILVDCCKGSIGVIHNAFTTKPRIAAYKRGCFATAFSDSVIPWVPLDAI